MNQEIFDRSEATRVGHRNDQGDLKRLVSAFRRRWQVALAVSVVVLVIVVIGTALQAPRYTGTSEVMIDTRKQDVSGLDAVLSGLPPDSSVVDTETEVLKSRSLAARVVQALDLGADPEFNATLHAPHGSTSSTQFLSHLFHLSDISPIEGVQKHIDTNQDGVIDAVLSHLSVKRVGLTYVIDINFQSRSPAKAALIANTFAERYLTQQLQDKYDATTAATHWLNERLAELEPQVESAEAEVQQYKAAHGLLSSGASTLTEQEISNISNALDQARVDAAERNARLQTAQADEQAGSSAGEHLSSTLNSQTIMQLRAQQALVSAKLSELETNYGPRHPEVLRAQHEMADINAQVGQEVARQVSNLQMEASIANQRVATLEASLRGAKGVLVGNDSAGVKLAELQRKSDAASGLYNSLLTRVKQTTANQGSEQSDVRIVSRAKLPRAPTFPNKMLNYAAGLALAIMAGVSAVFLIELLDSGLTTAEDIEHRFNVPILGTIPSLKSTAHNIPPKTLPGEYVVTKKMSVFAEAFRNLRASIMFSKIKSPVRVILVTSPLPGEGKTTSTFCLGRSMAMAGANIVVLDCDLRQRGLSQLVGSESKVGLIEVIKGDVTLDEALYLDKASGAYFLPLIKPEFTPKDLFSSPAMDRLLNELRERFEIILIDSAPILAVSETRLLAPKADAVVLLAQWRRTTPRALDLALGYLAQAGAFVAGVALVQVDLEAQAKLGYRDPSYYTQEYHKYYVH